VTPADLLKSDFHCSMMLSGKVAPAPVTVVPGWVGVSAIAAEAPTSNNPSASSIPDLPRFTGSPFLSVVSPWRFGAKSPRRRR
jgi:hypothetical protein